YAPWQADEDFQRVYRAVRRNTLVDVWRLYGLWSLLGELPEIPGSVPEVGVWRGGSGALLAECAAALGITDLVYLCDTWAGVVKTGPLDIYYRDGKHDDTSRATVAAS
ncbi:MAG: TylF/MycF/NovP-related O-methyltransferase, partial [Solirubrobacteraceae bacterium]